MIEKISKYSIAFLLCWYLVSIYVTTNDNTLSFGMMVSFQIISTLMIIITTRVLANGYKLPSITDYWTSFFLIFWFIYSTYRDYTESGYYYFLKVFYIGIDILSIIFLADTFINFLISSSIYNIGKDKIKKINNIVRIGLVSIFTIIYFILIRRIKWTQNF